MSTVRWLLLCICVVSAACSPAAPTSDSPPTLTLIAATATDIPTPVPPTLTLEPRTQPQDLFPTATVIPETTSEALIDIDPIAAELVSIAQRQVAELLDLPTRRIQLVEVVPYTWADSSLGCPAPNQSYTAVESYGYRIVLSAGNDEYIYHTDFDRVLVCDADNEQLPFVATPEATDEVESEITPEVTIEAE